MKSDLDEKKSFGYFIETPSIHKRTLCTTQEKQVLRGAIVLS